MARRNNQIAIAAGPGWTDVFKTSQAGGEDGHVGESEILVSCSADSANPAEYRLESPADPAGEAATLAPGEAVKLRGSRVLIQHVVMRGVGGAATGGIEVLAV